MRELIRVVMPADPRNGRTSRVWFRVCMGLKSMEAPGRCSALGLAKSRRGVKGLWGILARDYIRFRL